MSKKMNFKGQNLNAAVSGNCLTQEQFTQKVREVAQQLYEKRNRVPGNELGDWLEAEKIVKRTCTICGK